MDRNSASSVRWDPYEVWRRLVLADPDLRPCEPAFACTGGPLGPNKLLCSNPVLGPPPCLSDADCDIHFPGEGITCLNASALSLCLRECTP